MRSWEQRAQHYPGTPKIIFLAHIYKYLKDCKSKCAGSSVAVNKMSWVWILTIIPITFQTAHGFRVKLPRRCEEISVPLCVRVLPYNFTRFPNLVGHRSQVVARRSIDYYSSAFVEDANCAKHAAFFLCSFYLPICLPGIEEGVIKPCRFLCEKIKKDCPAIRKQWPSFLRCEELPKFSDGVCVQPMSFVPAHQPASKSLCTR